MTRTDLTEPARAAAPPTATAGATEGLRLTGLVVRYPAAGRRQQPVTAVAGVDLHVPTGEVLALLGPSGCGKSSLLRAVAGLEPVAGGTLAWDGADLSGVPTHRRGFGLVFQDGQLFGHRLVAGNVAYGLRGTSWQGRPARERRVAELLDLVGLPGYGARPVGTLSGGERQRVALARSLAPEPRLLLLDEPLSALDRNLRERLADDLRAVLTATGTTALFVTHDQDEAAVVADRVAVMFAGRVVQAGTSAELWQHPADREVARFLGYRTFLPAAGGGTLAVADGGWLLGEGTSETVAARVVGVRSRRGRQLVVAELDLDEGSVEVLADPGAAGVPGVGERVRLHPARRAATLLRED